MKHHKDIRKFGRPTKQRKALLQGLARSFILHGRIETTTARAKEMRPFVERLITESKNNSLASRRLVIARLGGDKKAAAKLFETIAPQYKERAGGYTRVIKTRVRPSDAAEKAVIEFV